jgi:DNA-binding MarR family transcriptional regulator
VLACLKILEMEFPAMSTAARWTFITNHGLVLSYIFHNSKSTAREIANYIGVTERTTHKIISDLESAGYIERRKTGRRNIYRVDPTLPLRHHTKQDILVEDVLEALSTKSIREVMAAGEQQPA